jgi:hypothetical protein
MCERRRQAKYKRGTLGAYVTAQCRANRHHIKPVAESQVSDSIEYSSGTRSVVQRRVSVIRGAAALAYDDPPS